MGSELVSDLPSHSEGVGDSFAIKQGKPTLSHTDVFYQCLPQYLAMGMTLEDFWNCDPRTYKAYRECQRIKLERTNEELWLQGMYIYEALCDVAPRYNSFKPKKGTDYSKKPYEIFKNEELDKPQSEEDKAVSYMNSWAKRVNKNYGK